MYAILLNALNVNLFIYIVNRCRQFNLYVSLYPALLY